MNWLLILHIVALLFWTALLVYLPALVSGTVYTSSETENSLVLRQRLPRLLFTHVATPIALSSIIAGTLVFVVYHNIGIWLIIKLTLVVLLVINHALLGLLILRAESGSGKPVRRWCLASALVTGTLIIAVLWVVLSKPPFESIP
ncbi:CopD family protein [Marinobacter sp. 1_MG-2023]|uniref:CopD family protein n=1 Tax=Marinobacter sp. 1_MG-2023 TaxID=3062627 RepID=UPI0026E32680|nr:CopD family protein [Marinobacter sp. 1_MG-2023]MDO6822948.1 CopD family protein [Marinobacter sp. 1_MG-2023]